MPCDDFDAASVNVCVVNIEYVCMFVCVYWFHCLNLCFNRKT